MKKVVCVGILVADIIAGGISEYPKKGQLTHNRSTTLHNGGNAMTAALNLKRLGVESAIIGKIGKDPFGAFLKERFQVSGVDIRGLTEDEDVQTSTSVVLLDEDGERSFLHCVGANGTFCGADINEAVIDDYDLVFVTGTFLLNTFDGKQTEEFLKACKQKGKTTFLDVCWDATGRWGELLNPCMPYIDYFLPSIDEAEMLSGETDPKRIAQSFSERGVKNTVIKMGHRGCFVKTEDMKAGVFVPSFKVQAVDTTGAGDSFCSGFLAAYANGELPLYCALIANAAGSCNVRAMGATGWKETYSELLHMAKERKDASHT